MEIDFWHSFCSIFAVSKFYIMFIKKIDKCNAKTGQSYFTYRLCESYRIGDKVRHRNILNVGKLENIRKEDFKFLCDRIEQKVKGINLLFSNLPAHIRKGSRIHLSQNFE